MAHVFISYRRSVSALLAQLIRNTLHSKGISAFVDTSDAETAGYFEETLKREIESAAVFVCLLADTTLESDWVSYEVKYAYELGKTLVPVFQESFSIKDQQSYAEYLTALLRSQGVKVLDISGEFVSAAIDKLIAILKQPVESRKFTETMMYPINWTVE